MLPQFNLVVEAAYADPFHAALGTVRVGGQPLTFKRSDNGFFSLDFGQPNLHDQPDAVTIAGEPRPLASLGLETVEIEDRSGTTAYHVPEGILAVYDPTRPPPANTTRPQVSVLEVAPHPPPEPGRRPPVLHDPAQAARRPAARLTHRPRGRRPLTPIRRPTHPTGRRRTGRSPGSAAGSADRGGRMHPFRVVVRGCGGGRVGGGPFDQGDRVPEGPSPSRPQGRQVGPSTTGSSVEWRWSAGSWWSRIAVDRPRPRRPDPPHPGG